MKVFLSWSGNISKEIAEELNKWIPTVVQFVKPYFSPSDIEKGSKWDSEITKNLNESTIGIICVTPNNMHSPWILFEAGALSNKLEKSRVCPLLFELSNPDLTGPLATFQTTIFNKVEFKKLIQTINKQLGENKVADSILDETFEMFFPKLESKVNEIIKKNQPENNTKVVERTERDILEEILELARRQYLIENQPTYDLQPTKKTYDLKKQYNSISDSEKKFINGMIYQYMQANKFRLAEYQQLDKELVYDYLKKNTEIKKAAGSPENLRMIISEFISQ